MYVSVSCTAMRCIAQRFTLFYFFNFYRFPSTMFSFYFRIPFCLYFRIKASGVMEGCVTITRKEKLEILRRIDLPLKNVLRNAPYLRGIYSIRPDLQDVLG